MTNKWKKKPLNLEKKMSPPKESLVKFIKNYPAIKEYSLTLKN
jgi:hypothetical protein